MSSAADRVAEELIAKSRRGERWTDNDFAAAVLVMMAEKVERNRRPWWKLW